MLLNVIEARITRLDTRFRNCVPPEKVLALGLFRLAHGNSYISIAPAMNVGKSTVIKAVQDVVESLFDLRNEYIKFPETEQETAALIRTFEEYPDLPNIAGVDRKRGCWCKIKFLKKVNGYPCYFLKIPKKKKKIKRIVLQKNGKKKCLKVNPLEKKFLKVKLLTKKN